jgi:hypothetical protein
MTGDSCPIYLTPAQATIPAIPIGRANGIGPTGCQTRVVSARKEIPSVSEAGGNGDRIYFAPDSLKLVSTGVVCQMAGA